MATCPVCENNYICTLSFIEKVADSNRMQCLICNCAFIDPLPIELPRYDTDYNLEFSRPSERNKAIIMARTLLDEFGWEKSTGKILEVGPGNGWTLTELKELGIGCEGVELDPEYAAFLTKKIKIPVYGGGIHAMTTDTKYKIVYSSHVIEHFADPVGYLQTAKEILADNGKIFIDTPDFDCAGHPKHTWHHFQTRTPFEHLCVLSKKAIGVCAARAGLKLRSFKRSVQYGSFQAVLVV